VVAEFAEFPDHQGLVLRTGFRGAVSSRSGGKVCGRLSVPYSKVFCEDAINPLFPNPEKKGESVSLMTLTSTGFGSLLQADFACCDSVCLQPRSHPRKRSRILSIFDL